MTMKAPTTYEEALKVLEKMDKTEAENNDISIETILTLYGIEDEGAARLRAEQDAKLAAVNDIEGLWELSFQFSDSSRMQEKVLAKIEDVCRARFENAHDTDTLWDILVNTPCDSKISTDILMKIVSLSRCTIELWKVAYQSPDDSEARAAALKKIVELTPEPTP